MEYICKFVGSSYLWVRSSPCGQCWSRGPCWQGRSPAGAGPVIHHDGDGDDSHSDDDDDDDDNGNDDNDADNNDADDNDDDDDNDNDKW